MELISAIASTVLGKIAAGTVVAAAGVAGLDAADIVEVPGLEDTSETVITEDTPQDAEGAKDLAEAKKAAAAAEEEGEEAEETQTGQDEVNDAEETDKDGGEAEANDTFGHQVSEQARDEDRVPGKEFGQGIAADARAKDTPAADRAAQPEGRPTAPDEVRQDEANRGAEPDVDGETVEEDATEEETTEEQPPAAPASQASENRPADAGAGKGR